MVVKQMIEASMKKSADIRRTRLLHVFTNTSQIMDTAEDSRKYHPDRPPMNHFVVVCNLLLLAMMKITQLFPNRPKKVKNQPTIPNQSKCIVYCL